MYTMAADQPTMYHWLLRPCVCDLWLKILDTTFQIVVSFYENDTVGMSELTNSIANRVEIAIWQQLHEGGRYFLI